MRHERQNVSGRTALVFLPQGAPAIVILGRSQPCILNPLHQPKGVNKVAARVTLGQGSRPPDNMRGEDLRQIYPTERFRQFALGVGEIARVAVG